jgi:hypothetical protein
MKSDEASRAAYFVLSILSSCQSLLESDPGGPAKGEVYLFLGRFHGTCYAAAPVGSKSDGRYQQHGCDLQAQWDMVGARNTGRLHGVGYHDDRTAFAIVLGFILRWCHDIK